MLFRYVIDTTDTTLWRITTGNLNSDGVTPSFALTPGDSIGSFVLLTVASPLSFYAVSELSYAVLV